MKNQQEVFGLLANRKLSSLFSKGNSRIYNLAYIGERKKFCHSLGKAVDLLLTICMLVEEVADLLFDLGLTFGSPCTERSLVMGPLFLLIS